MRRRRLPIYILLVASISIVFLSNSRYIQNFSRPAKVDPRATVVTAYFNVSSKHSHELYSNWIRNFLSLVDDMIIFTSPQLAPLLRYTRGTKMNRTVILEVELAETYVPNMFPRSFWERQLAIDPERELHRSYELFHIWLNKPFFVSKAVELNPFNSTMFAWSDIGCYRNTVYNNKRWLIATHLVPEENLLAMAISRPRRPAGTHLLTKHYNASTGEWFMGGTQLIGYSDVWRHFANAYEKVIRQYHDAGIFLGDDQPVLQMTCHTAGLCEFVTPEQVIGDPYFGLQEILHFGNVTPPWYSMANEYVRPG